MGCWDSRAGLWVREEPGKLGYSWSPDLCLLNGPSVWVFLLGISMYFEPFLCTRNYAKGPAGIISFNLHDIPANQVLLLPSIY